MESRLNRGMYPLLVEELKQQVLNYKGLGLAGFVAGLVAGLVAGFLAG